MYYPKYLSALLGVLCCLLTSAKQKEEGVTFINSKSHQSVMHKAFQQDKPVFIYFYHSNCYNCKHALRTQFTADDVGVAFNFDFINVAYDLKKEEFQSIANKYNILDHHTLLCLTPDGGVIDSQGGIIDNFQIIKFAKQSKSDFEWFQSYLQSTGSGELKADEVYRYLSYAPDYVRADELLDKLYTQNQDLMKSSIALEMMERYYEHTDFSSFQKLCGMEFEIPEPLQEQYQKVVYYIYTREFEDKSTLEIEKILKNWNEPTVGHDAALDRILKIQEDSIFSLVAELKIRDAEKRDALFESYIDDLNYWLIHRSFNPDIIREKVFYLGQTGFQNYEVFQKAMKTMVNALYNSDELYWSYYTDAYLQSTLGHNYSSMNLLDKAIVELKRSDPANINLLYHFQVKRKSLSAIKP